MQHCDFYRYVDVVQLSRWIWKGKWMQVRWVRWSSHQSKKSHSDLLCWFASCETMRKWGTASSRSADAFVMENCYTGYFTNNLNIYKEFPFLQNVSAGPPLFITISVSFHSCHWTLKTLLYLKKWAQKCARGKCHKKAHIWQYGVKSEGYKLNFFFLQFFLQTPPLSFCYLPTDTLREPVFTHQAVKFVKKNFLTVCIK